MPLPLVIPLIAAGISAIGGIIGNAQQKRANQKLADQQAANNERYLKMQLDYNSPASQMARFREAGLNPYLMYSQGNPGNQGAPLSYPDVSPTDVGMIWRDIVPNFTNMMLAQAQVKGLDAKVNKDYAQADLAQQQAKLIQRNPLLDDAGFKATIDSLIYSAQLKAQDAGLRAIQKDVAVASSGHVVSKIFHEVNLLEQRFKLGETDKAIKAEILKSKEFQNAILDVQKKFMTDSDITPQHIYQFVSALILKMF